LASAVDDGSRDPFVLDASAALSCAIDDDVERETKSSPAATSCVKVRTM
jgi:hypothetical protein